MGGGLTNKSQHYHIYDYETDFFSSMTTYHGLVRIYNNRYWWGRWFWMAVVFTSFSLFLTQARSAGRA